MLLSSQLCIFLLLPDVVAFSTLLVSPRMRPTSLFSTLDDLESIRSMRASVIQAELKEMGISTADIFEKDELAKRLFAARRSAQAAAFEEQLPKNDAAVSDVDDKKVEEDPEALLGKVQKMKAKELKAELSALGISTADVFEKDELVKRLVKAWTEKPADSVPMTDAMEGPLMILSSIDNVHVDAVNTDGFSVRGGQLFPAISIVVLDNGGFPLNLLIDTACTGVVIQPDIVMKHGLRLMSTPISMLGAAGTREEPKLTQFDRFQFGGDTFGPLPVAVQNIGSMLPPLNGIIGLSFLSQFACVELHVANRRLNLYKTTKRPPVPQNRELLVEAEMIPVDMGLFVLEIGIDRRRPIRLLVDTGAGTSILTWEGINTLGLTRSSPELIHSSNPTGAVGSDNIALSFSHRLVVSEGLSVAGTDVGAHPYFDVGPIPVVQVQLADSGVGGVLGSDFFCRFPMVRFSFQGPRFTVAFFK